MAHPATPGCRRATSAAPSCAAAPRGTPAMPAPPSSKSLLSWYAARAALAPCSWHQRPRAFCFAGTRTSACTAGSPTSARMRSTFKPPQATTWRWRRRRAARGGSDEVAGRRAASGMRACARLDPALLAAMGAMHASLLSCARLTQSWWETITPKYLRPRPSFKRLGQGFVLSQGSHNASIRIVFLVFAYDSMAAVFARRVG